MLGSTGTLDLDGLTIDEVPRGDRTSTNLVLNSDFELGDPDPSFWVVEGGARRAFPGFRSDSAVELTRSGAKALGGLGVPAGRLAGVEVRLKVCSTTSFGFANAATKLTMKFALTFQSAYASSSFRTLVAVTVGGGRWRRNA